MLLCILFFFVMPFLYASDPREEKIIGDADLDSFFRLATWQQIASELPDYQKASSDPEIIARVKAGRRPASILNQSDFVHFFSERKMHVCRVYMRL